MYGHFLILSCKSNEKALNEMEGSIRFREVVILKTMGTTGFV
jgi:hypothetical protein